MILLTAFSQPGIHVLPMVKIEKRRRCIFLKTGMLLIAIELPSSKDWQIYASSFLSAFCVVGDFYAFYDL